MTEPWTIDLQLNDISIIGDYAFSNLKDYANGNNVSLKPAVNRLRNISDSAFSGNESLIIYLCLRTSQLQIVRFVVSKLTNLPGLSLPHNPLTNKDNSNFNLSQSQQNVASPLNKISDRITDDIPPQ